MNRGFLDCLLHTAGFVAIAAFVVAGLFFVLTHTFGVPAWWLLWIYVGGAASFLMGGLLEGLGKREDLVWYLGFALGSAVLWPLLFAFLAMDSMRRDAQ